MRKYVLKRIGYMIVVTIILSFLMFLLYSLTPQNRAYTDARQEMQTRKMQMRGMSAEQREQAFNDLYLEYQRNYGTDTENIVVRYLRWVGVAPNYYGKYNGILQGNFGWSYEHKADVLSVVMPRMINTVYINIFVTIIALGITIPLGIFQAVHHGSKRDQVIQIVTIIGYSLPNFIIGILFIWIFCSNLGWFPPSGMKTPGSNYTGLRWLVDSIYYLTLPVMAMVFTSLGSMARYVRASMMDALSLDCIRTARAKGVREKVIIYSHAWRNALIPIVTLVIGWFLGIFYGSLMFENIFALNGMGRLNIMSLGAGDYDVTMIIQMFYVIIGLVGNLVVDLIYGLVDPRVRVSA